MDPCGDLEARARIRLRLLAMDRAAVSVLGEARAMDVRREAWKALGQKGERRSGMARPTASTRSLSRMPCCRRP